MKLESIIPIKMDELGSKVKLSKRDNLGTKFDLPINLLYISVITIAIGLTIMIIIYWIAFINYAQIEIIQIKWPNKFWIIFIAIGAIVAIVGGLVFRAASKMMNTAVMNSSGGGGTSFSSISIN
ncbi:hypothetical protein NH340_JMT02550 [Sarcoptes scabiei]|nr:hypothetical protein NH340_JMT02550 [Sarcoptes scabiei]